MPTRCRLVLLALFFLSFNLPHRANADASAAPPGDCGQEKGGAFAYKYCIYRTPGSNSTDVLWFLHGRDGDEHSWETDTHYANIRALWAAQDPTNIPIVIGVSFGGQWLLVSKLSKAASGMLQFFENSVVPEMENQAGFKNGRRLLLGESMGGFSAAQLLLSGNVRFDRVVLACPALAWISPYAKMGDIVSWAEQNGVNLAIAISVVITARGDFASTEEWESASPMYLATDRLGPLTPPMLVSIGQQDTFGFYPGARDFATIAKQQSGSEVTWQPVPGPHCSFDETAAANFALATN